MKRVRERVREIYQRYTSDGGVALYRGMVGVVGGVTRTGFVSVMLRVLIVVELVVLGVGVVRRLERSYDRAMEAARAELAVLEARELQEEAREKKAGTAGIGATENLPSYVKDETSDTREAPEMRARDVATIISEDTGDLDAAASVLEGESEVGDETASSQEETRNEDARGAVGQGDIDDMIRRGVAAMISGDMKRSILCLEQARAIDPEHPAMLYYYGMAFDKLLNPRKARDFYSKLFNMREQAGKYFTLASRRLTYGVEQPDALRGKLAFGPKRLQHTFDTEQGESVNVILPVLLAPGEHVRPDDIYITIQFFELVNGRKIDFARNSPKLSWVNERPAWDDSEEDLMVSYNVPINEGMEADTAADVKYYGFTAKLYYRGEPLDCISEPSALILHEQRINSKRQGTSPGGLLPDDGLIPDTEEAIPYSEAMEEPDETNR